MSKRIVVTPQPRPADIDRRLAVLLDGQSRAATVGQLVAAAKVAQNVPTTPARP